MILMNRVVRVFVAERSSVIASKYFKTKTMWLIERVYFKYFEQISIFNCFKAFTIRDYIIFATDSF